jgi:hypothetical protein
MYEQDDKIALVFGATFFAGLIVGAILVAGAWVLVLYWAAQPNATTSRPEVNLGMCTQEIDGSLNCISQPSAPTSTCYGMNGLQTACNSGEASVTTHPYFSTGTVETWSCHALGCWNAQHNPDGSETQGEPIPCPSSTDWTVTGAHPALAQPGQCVAVAPAQNSNQ